MGMNFEVCYCFFFDEKNTRKGAIFERVDLKNTQIYTESWCTTEMKIRHI